MINIIRSEFIKSKNTSINKFIWVAPLLTTVIAFLLGGGQNGAYNWWYTLFLPGTLSIISAHIITSEKKLSYKGLFLYPIEKRNIWLGKIAYITILLIETSIIFMISIYAISFISPITITLKDNVTATIILILAFLFQIPINLLLTTKFNMYVAVLFSMFMSMVSTVSFGSSAVIRFSPYGIGQYLMCPVLHIFPNGLPVPKGSPFLNRDMVISNIIIGFIIFVILSIITMKWFQNRGGN